MSSRVHSNFILYLIRAMNSNQTLHFLMQLDKHNYCNLTYIEEVLFQIVKVENKYLYVKPSLTKDAYFNVIVASEFSQLAGNQRIHPCTVHYYIMCVDTFINIQF